jgi:hypothetical protein
VSHLPLIVPHSLAAPALEVIPAALVARMESAIADAIAIDTVDATNKEAAESAAQALHLVLKDVQAQVEKIKKPLNQLRAAVLEIGERAEVPASRAKITLIGKIAAYNRAVREAEDAERLRVERERRAAADAAAAEQKRLETEAQAKAEQEARDLEAVLGAPVEAKPEPVAPVRPAPVAASPAPLPSAASAVVTKRVPKLVIDDPRAVAAAYQIGGVTLVEINRGAVQKCIDAGLTVPGARIEMVEQSVMRGAR